MADEEGLGDRRREDAARAAWLYFIGGRTQDEIAKQLNLSRQATQRLVALAVNQRLVKFKIDHPVATCVALGSRMIDRFGLDFCDVTPSDKAASGSVAQIAVAAARRLNKLLAVKTPMILAVGTGRTLRAMVENLDAFDRPQHKILSLVGNMSANGRASEYEVAMRIADKLNAQRYPMALPVLTETVEERRWLQRQKAYRMAQDLYRHADASFVGIAETGWQSPLHVDGFVDDREISELSKTGAVGEIIGWAIDAGGQLVRSSINERVSSLRLTTPPAHLTVIVGCGSDKALPIKAALRGRFGNALITDEATASAIMDMPDETVGVAPQLTVA